MSTSLEELEKRLAAIVGSAEPTPEPSGQGPAQPLVVLRRMKADLGLLKKDVAKAIRERRAHYASHAHHLEPSGVCRYVEGVLNRGLVQPKRSSSREVQSLLLPYKDMKRRVEGAISDVGRRIREQTAPHA